MKNKTVNPDLFLLAKQLQTMASQYRNLLERSGQGCYIKIDPYLADTNKILTECGYDFLTVKTK